MLVCVVVIELVGGGVDIWIVYVGEVYFGYFG